MKNKFISICLSLLMVVSMVPFGEMIAYGAEPEISVENIVHSQIIRDSNGSYTSVYQLAITGNFEGLTREPNKLKEVVILKGGIPITTENVITGSNTIIMDIVTENEFISEINPDDTLDFKFIYGEDEASKTVSSGEKLGTILTMQGSDIEDLVKSGDFQMAGSGEDAPDNSKLSLSVDSEVGETVADSDPTNPDFPKIYVNLQGRNSSNALEVGSIERQATAGREKLDIESTIQLVEEGDNRIIIRNGEDDVSSTSRIVYEYIYVDPAPNYNPFVEEISVENGPISSDTNTGDENNRVIANIRGENFISFYIEDEDAFKMPQVYLLPRVKEGSIDFTKDDQVLEEAMARYDSTEGSQTKLKGDPLLEKYRVHIKDDKLYKDGKELTKSERLADEFVGVFPASDLVGKRDIVMVTPDGSIYRGVDAFEYVDRLGQDSEAEIKDNSVKPEKVNYEGGEEVSFKGENIFNDPIITVDGVLVDPTTIEIETNRFTGENTVKFETPKGFIGKKIIQVITKNGDQLSLDSYNYAFDGTSGVVQGGDKFEYVNYKERPVINSISPAKGIEGQPVFLSGDNLREEVEVHLENSAGKRVKVTPDERYNNTSLKFTVPDLGAPGQYKIIAVNKDGSESTEDIAFTYTISDPQETIVIDSVSPNYAIKGQEKRLTIEGSGFQSDAIVTIGGKLGTNIRVSGDGRTIKLDPPKYEEFAESGDVEGLEIYVYNVSDASFKKYEDTFSYFEFSNNPAIIEEVDPDEGSTFGGETITLYGNFYLGTDDTEPDSNNTDYWPEVYFGDEKAEYVPNEDGDFIWNSNRLDVKLPSYNSDGLVDITVVNHISNRGITDLEDAFTYKQSAPEIGESIEIPLNGGATKYISGRDFISFPQAYTNTKSKNDEEINMDIEVIFSDEVYTEKIRGQETVISMEEGQGRKLQVKYDPNDTDGQGNLDIDFTMDLEPGIAANVTKEDPLYFSTKTSSDDNVEEGMKISVDENELKVERRVAKKTSVTRNGTLIEIETPPMRRTGQTKIIVRNADGGQAEIDVNVVDPNSTPVITDIDEKQSYKGPEGELVDEYYFVDSSVEGERIFTIRGSDFRTGVEVYIGYGMGEENRAEVLEKGLNDDYLVVKSPPKGENVEFGEKLPIVVKNRDGASASSAESSIGSPPYPAWYIYRESTSIPLIDSIEPDKGSASGGERVEIHGQDFRPNENIEVRFGGLEANVLVEESDYEMLVVETPPSDIYGPVDVSVRNVDSFGEDVLEDGFTYTSAPVILEVKPDIVYANGGEEVEIIGKGFQEGARVSIGDVEVEVEYIDNFTLNIITPEVDLPNGVDEVKKDITIVNPDGGETTREGAITFVRPFPMRPTGFEAKARDGRLIELKWDNLEVIDRYRIEVSEYQNGPYRYLAEVSDGMHMVRDLDPDTEYFFRLYAINEYGRSENYASASARTLSEEDDNQNGDFEDSTATESQVTFSGGNLSINYSKTYTTEDYTHDLTASKYRNAKKITLNLPASVINDGRGRILLKHFDIELESDMSMLKSSERAYSDSDTLRIELTKMFDGEQSEAIRRLPYSYSALDTGYKVTYSVGDGTYESRLDTIGGVQLTALVESGVLSDTAIYRYNRGDSSAVRENSYSRRQYSSIHGREIYKIRANIKRSGYYIPSGR